MPAASNRMEITPKTIIFCLALLFGVYFVYQIREVLILLMVAVIFITAINPIITRLERYGLPRPLSISLVYLLALSSLFIVVAGLIPPLVNQTAVLLDQITLPDSVKQQFSTFDYNLQDLQVILSQLDTLPHIIESISSAFNALMLIITFAVISFYLLLERPHLHQHLVRSMGHTKSEHEAEKFINRLEAQIGGWVRGELLLMFVIGLLTYLGLTIIRVPYALPLAILAGLLEILPMIGPIIAAIPAVLITYFFFDSVWLGIIVTILYIIIQQLENNFIVPTVMKKATGLNPLITIITLLIGIKLGGMIGAILAIPILLSIKVILVESYKFKHPDKPFRLDRLFKS